MNTLTMKDKYSGTIYVLHGDENELYSKLAAVVPGAFGMAQTLPDLLSALEEVGRYEIQSDLDEEDNSEPLRLEIPMEWVYANEMEGRGE